MVSLGFTIDLDVSDTMTAGPVATTEEFEATCAATGTSAQCCLLAVGADGLVCTAA
jgi:hypothetical protein